jgi:hypothetical protein
MDALTTADRELLEQIRNGYRQQEEFVMDQLVEESIEDCPA